MTATNPLLAAFVAEHPKYAVVCGVPAPGDESNANAANVSALDAFGAFVRWCLRRGHADAVTIAALVSEYLPCDEIEPMTPPKKKRRRGRSTGATGAAN